ncbi:MAG: hypothetical protein AB7F23_09965 [Phycisphaerae bacterium]|jgi:hypothetical protein
MKNELQKELHALLNALCEGSINEQEFAKLDQLLSSSPEACNIYIDYMSICSDLRYCQVASATKSEKESSAVSGSATDADILDLMILHELAEMEKNAPAVQRTEEREVLRECVSVKPEKRKMSRGNKLTLSACAAVVLLLVCLNFLAEKSYSVDVATVTDQINTKWLGASLKTGDRLRTNKGLYLLDRGFAEFRFDEGVSVVAEGPAKFAIERSGVYMEYGRLYCKVSDTGLGFFIETPTTRVVDQGTEFGIQAEINGSAQLHVTKGKAQLFAGAKGDAKTAMLVTESKAVKYNAFNFEVSEVPVEKETFVRSIDSDTNFVWRGEAKIELADIVGGGNGFGKGRLDYGINHEGQTELLSNIVAYTKPAPFAVVEGNPFVDGVFVPYGLTQINSTNNEDEFDFGATSGKYYLGILNGAWHKQNDNAVPRHLLRLGDTQYGTSEHSAIYIHANQGITFDLQAIRDYTQMEIGGLTAECGLSATYGDYAEAIKRVRQFPEVKTPKASFYVIVDGVEKFSRKDISYLDEPAVITVQIEPQDRFLTLATIESDDRNDGDWTLFGEPVLNLQCE